MRRVVTTDVLVLGGGGAGARAAMAVDDCRQDCLLVSKGPIAHSGATPMACPSYQAAVSIGYEDDTPQIAFSDTQKEGRNLGDENLIWALTHEATDRAHDLERYGVKFRKKGDAFLQVAHPGQSFARNLVIKGCGYSMMFHMRRELLTRPGITLWEDAMALELLCRAGEVAGAVVLDLRTGEVVDVWAGATILATGGYPELWLRTDTTPELTGDGQALALRAGAELIDLEMMLWYPTCLTAPQEITGTLVQYEGLLGPEYCAGVLLNANGDRFLPEGPLPVRDIMMRSMFTEIDEGRATRSGGLYIDLRPSPRSKAEMQRLLRTLDSLPYHNLRDLGIDISCEPIEVAPATHYTLGGVGIDEWGRTSVAGLFACGEVAGNVHGANRTSGNALTETQVFGARAGEAACRHAKNASRRYDSADEGDVAEEAVKELVGPAPPTGALRPRSVKQGLKETMHHAMGHHRDEAGMQRGLEDVIRRRRDELPLVRAGAGRAFSYELQEAVEVGLMLDLAEAVLTAGLLRRESRGHHWRLDLPDSDPAWLCHTMVRREGSRTVVGTRPVARVTAGAPEAVSVV